MHLKVGIIHSLLTHLLRLQVLRMSHHSVGLLKHLYTFKHKKIFQIFKSLTIGFLQLYGSKYNKHNIETTRDKNQH